MRIELSDLLWIGILCAMYLVSALFPGMLIFIGAFILLAILAYEEDKKREKDGQDDFRRDGLFYRYGAEIGRTIIPIPVPASWQLDETTRAVVSLRELLADRLRIRLQITSAGVVDPAPISNKDRGYEKLFVKIVAHAPQGSLLVYFGHFASFGNSMVAHYFAFSRGLVNPWRLVRFVLESPITIWAWGIPWLQNRFSILAAVSRVEDDSYEMLDLQTIHTTLSRLVLDSIQEVLSEKGLLTAEVAGIIQQQINYNQQFRVGSLQQISISRSPKFKIDQISQSPEPQAES